MARNTLIYDIRRNDEKISVFETMFNVIYFKLPLTQSTIGTQKNHLHHESGFQF